MIANRSRKAQAPEFLKPTGKWKNRQEMIDDFQQSRDRANRVYRQGRRLNAPSLCSAPCDGGARRVSVGSAESAHSERHTAQIREVKAEAGFPK